MNNALIIARQFAKHGAEAGPELAAAAVPKPSTCTPRRLVAQAAALIMLAESSANGQDLRQNAPIQEWGARDAVPPEGSPVQLQLSYGTDSQFLASGGVRPGGDYVGRLGL